MSSQEKDLQWTKQAILAARTAKWSSELVIAASKVKWGSTMIQELCERKLPHDMLLAAANTLFRKTSFIALFDSNRSQETMIAIIGGRWFCDTIYATSTWCDYMVLLAIAEQLKQPDIAVVAKAGWSRDLVITSLNAIKTEEESEKATGA